MRKLHRPPNSPLKDMIDIAAFATPQPLPTHCQTSHFPCHVSKQKTHAHPRFRKNPRMVTVEGVSTQRPRKSIAELEKRPIGNSDLILTEVCLGTMTWGHQNSEVDAHDQLDFAFERGVIGIDCAEIYPVPPRKDSYGCTEEYIGSWIKKRGGTSFREKLTLCSKVAGASVPGRGLPWIRGEDRKLDRANIREAVDGILSRLGTDYIDLLQVHWPDRYVPMFGAGAYDAAKEHDSVSFEEQISAMNELIREGKIRNYGLSNETAWGVAQFHGVANRLGAAAPISVQNNYNLIYRDFEAHLAEACAPSNANMSLLAYSPLAGGALTGKYLSKKVPNGARFDVFPNYMKRFQSSLAAAAIAEYQKIANDAGLTLTQLSLAWCKSRWFVQSTIIGATSVAQLEEDIDSFAVNLDSATIGAINSVYSQYRDPSKTS